MNLPKYPDSRPLEIKDIQVFNQIFKADPPVISEFTFTNLYAWREAYKFRVAEKNGFIMVYSDSVLKKRFFAPLGAGDIKTLMETILKEKNCLFFRVPENVKALFENDPLYRIEFDADNSDYLFKSADLIALPGKKYDGKRNLIKKFKSFYHYEYLKLESPHADECFQFEEEWCSIKNCDSVEGLFKERRAIREMIVHCAEFDLVAGAIRVEGKICALAIAQQLNPDTLVLHVLKANPAMVGLYQVICNEFLANQAREYEFVNMEQDLGVEGLRRSKLSYHPNEMIKKFEISLAEG
jgi:uncharacterized protein